MFQVKLLLSPLGSCQTSDIVVYHASVLVDEKEFCFTEDGIVVGYGHRSHGGAPDIIDFGETERSGEQVQAALRPHFSTGTWDAVRKSAVTFADCALAFLVGHRLPLQYRAVERIGLTTECRRVLHAAYNREYHPNPRARGFDHNLIINAITMARPRISAERAASLRNAVSPAPVAQTALGNRTDTAESTLNEISENVTTALETMTRDFHSTFRNFVSFMSQGIPGIQHGVDSASLTRETATMVVGSEREGTSDDTKCAVCFEAFAQGDELRILPCLHRYHKECVDTWLREHTTCPVCKHSIT